MNKSMKHTLYIIYIAIVTTLLPMVVVGCADDSADLEPREVTFCVQAVWQNGRSSSGRSYARCLPEVAHKVRRSALAATDLLAEGTDDLPIEFNDYPATIAVSCSDGQNFTLTKGAALCTQHGEYWQYTPSIIYKDRSIRRDNLTFTASATIDEGDELTGTANKADLHDAHLQFTLHHTKALLRFAFKVSEKYDKVRYIRVTGISLNGSPCTLVDKVLTTDGQLIAYCYIDPTVVTTSHENTLRCTYNIYDKDEATDAHLTREGVTAQNKFTLDKIVFSSSAAEDHKIKPGYYYDLRVTLNPDYLYVLSEHDNKHITIN